MDTSGDLIPSLDQTNSVFPHLKGKFPVGTNSYTNIVIDVYQLDQEGWNNGILYAFGELSDFSTYTNGFPQGSKYLASVPVPNTGSFDVNLSGLDLGAGLVTVTANYSADPPGTHRGRTQTSNFSNPILFLVMALSSSGTNIVLSWSAAAGSFTVQSTTTLAAGSWNNMTPQPAIVQVGDQFQALI